MNHTEQEIEPLLGRREPKSFMKQVPVLFSLAWPIVVSNLLQFSISSISIFSLGHISTTALAAFSLANLLANVTGLCISQGIASALNTLCSQSITASKDYHAIGKHLQRGVFLSFIVSLPISALWYFSEPFFLLLGQEEDISRISALFLQWMIAGLFPLFVSECLKRFLICQGMTKPSMYIMIFAAAQSLFLQWFLVWSPWNIGVIGAPVSISIVNVTVMALHIVYIIFSKAGDRFGGWEFNEMIDIYGLTQIIALAVPGTLMIVSEWIAYEAVALAAGLLGTTSLAAQTIAINTDSLLFMIPMGVSVATSTRIGNLLGANKPSEAKRVAFIGLTIALLPALIHASILLILRKSWGLIFTANPEVIKLVSVILPLAAFNQVADTVASIAGGALRGAGLQSVGATVNFVGYGVIGVPLALIFSFKLGFGLLGLWMGLAIGLAFTSCTLVIYLLGINWKNESQKARLRQEAEECHRQRLLEESDESQCNDTESLQEDCIL